MQAMSGVRQSPAPLYKYLPSRHACLAASGAFLPAHKIKWESAFGLRGAILRGQDGQDLWMGRSVARGHFGKLHFGVDAAGNALAIKEFRLEPRAAKCRRTTTVSSLPVVLAELAALHTAPPMMRPHRTVEAEGKVYVAMPLWDGNLQELFAAPAPASDAALARWVIWQTACRLHDLHRVGMVHRDVKPENILFCGAGDVQLCDYGMACHLGAVRAHDGGTRGFTPPEFIAARHVTTQYDAFSLGITACDLLGGAGRPRPENWQAAQTANDALFAWRQALLDRHGRVQLDRIGRHLALPCDRSKWDRAFAAVKRADPALCAFILGRLLDPLPARRASMAETADFVASLLDPAQIARAREHMAQASQKNIERRAALHALRAAVTALRVDADGARRLAPPVR